MGRTLSSCSAFSDLLCGQGCAWARSEKPHLKCWLLSCTLGLPMDRRWIGQLLLDVEVQQGLEGGEDRPVFAVFVAPFVPMICERPLK